MLVHQTLGVDPPKHGVDPSKPGTHVAYKHPYKRTHTRRAHFYVGLRLLSGTGH